MNSESVDAIFLGITQIKHLALCLLVHLIPYTAPGQLSFALKSQGPTTFRDQRLFPLLFLYLDKTNKEWQKI